MFLISRKVLISIARFCNSKNLLGKKRIRVHKNRTKADLLFDMKKFFIVILLKQSFRLIPLNLYRPLLPEIQYQNDLFLLNGTPVQSLSQWSPFFVA